MKFHYHLLTLVCLSLSSTLTLAAEYQWTDWAAAATGLQGSANGALQLSATDSITVEYTGEVTLAQTEDNTDNVNYFVPAATYVAASVSNPPPAGEMIALSGTRTDAVNTLRFSQPVTDPVLAIVSLGQPEMGVSYRFDAPFTILQQGIGYWGSGLGDAPAAGVGLLTIPEPQVLTGNEGDGLIQFSGTFESISWTVEGHEGWHGFTLGVQKPTASVLVEAPCYTNDTADLPQYDLQTQVLTLPHVIARSYNAAYLSQQVYHYMLELTPLGTPELRFLIKHMQLIKPCPQVRDAGKSRQLVNQFPITYSRYLPSYNSDGLTIPYLQVANQWYKVKLAFDTQTALKMIFGLAEVELLSNDDVPAELLEAR